MAYEKDLLVTLNSQTFNQQFTSAYSITIATCTFKAVLA